MASEASQNTTVTTRGASFPDLELAYLALTRFATLVVIGVGLPGNLMAFLVAIKKSNSHLSTCVYMAGLAVADSAVLFNLLCVNIIIFWKIGENVIRDRSLMYRLVFKY
jgi:hypothetical protein